MHDERDLRAVFADAQGPGDGQGNSGVFVLQSGPAAGPCRVWKFAIKAYAEWDTGEVDQALD